MPALFRHLDAVLLGRGLDPLPGCIAFGITHTFDLIEPRNSVAHMARAFERFLALLGERERPFSRSSRSLAVSLVIIFSILSSRNDQSRRRFDRRES